MTGITTHYTGSPFTVTTSGADPAGLGLLLTSSAASSLLDMVCNPGAGAPHTIAQWFDASCFLPTPQGQVRPGNAGRGVIRGPGFGNWDASLMKNFKMGERFNLQLRGESFNLPNHPNPYGLGGGTATGSTINYTSTLFGQIAFFRAPRRIQIGAKTAGTPGGCKSVTRKGGPGHAVSSNRSISKPSGRKRWRGSRGHGQCSNVSDLQSSNMRGHRTGRGA